MIYGLLRIKLERHNTNNGLWECWDSLASAVITMFTVNQQEAGAHTRVLSGNEGDTKIFF